MWYRKRDKQVLAFDKPGFYNFHKLYALEQISKPPPDLCFLSSKVVMINLTFGLFIRINLHHVHLYPLPHVGHMMLINMFFPFLLLLPTSVNLAKFLTFYFHTHTYTSWISKSSEYFLIIFKQNITFYKLLHICVTISCIMRLWDSLEIRFSIHN